MLTDGSSSSSSYRGMLGAGAVDRPDVVDVATVDLAEVADVVLADVVLADVTLATDPLRATRLTVPAATSAPDDAQTTATSTSATTAFNFIFSSVVSCSCYDLV